MSFRRSKNVENNTHVIGGHGAAIAEWNWDNLARYAVSEPSLFLPTTKDTKHYSHDSGWWFREKRGSFIAIAILVLILVILYGLGQLAWKNPLLFWGVPVLIALVGGGPVVWYSSRVEGMDFSDRHTVQKRAGRMSVALAGIMGLWFLVSGVALGVSAWPHAGWMHSSAEWLLQPWELFFPPTCCGSQFVGAVRALSVTGFIYAVWKVLTRV